MLYSLLIVAKAIMARPEGQVLHCQHPSIGCRGKSRMGKAFSELVARLFEWDLCKETMR
jgi:hypothetical protein